MAQYGKSIKVNMDFLPNFAKKMANKSAQYDIIFENRIRKATQMVWAIAHQKRPIISAKQMGRLVENGRHMNIVREGATKRVSDPNARAGVPVDTGALQASIIQKVTKVGKGYQGEVSTKGIPYAGYMEYGTALLRARPFMRPAIALTVGAIQRVMGLKIETNMNK